MKCCLCKQDAVLTLLAPVAQDLVPVDGEPDVLEFVNYNEKFAVCEQHFPKVRDMNVKTRANLFAVLKMATADPGNEKEATHG